MEVLCEHIKQAVSLSEVIQKYEKLGYAKNEKFRKQLHCRECDVVAPFLWSCMHPHCDFIGCGRRQQQHCLQHNEQFKEHNLCINLTTLEIWCYGCNSGYHIHYDENKAQTKLVKQLTELLVQNLASDKQEPMKNLKKSGQIPGVCGLANLGNTCYLNASLQALSHCDQLTQFFQNYEIFYKNKRARIVHDYANVVQDLWSGKFTSISPSSVVRDIFTVNAQLRGFAQQDAQEFLRCIIDQLYEGLKEEIFVDMEDRYGPLPSQPEEHQLENESDANQKEKEDEKPKKEEPTIKRFYSSIIESIFGGTLLSTIKCNTCQHISRTRELFYDLSVSLPDDRLRSLIYARQRQYHESTIIQEKEGLFYSLSNLLGMTSRTFYLRDLLHGFCVAERLTGREQYKCEKCKELREATKVFTIYKSPQVLTIHIKRFRHDTYFGSKLNDMVLFPLEDLEISSFSATVQENKQQNQFYDLVAAVCHEGSLYGGHYIAYAKNKHSNKWYEFNDRKVSPVSEDTVRGVQAYLLIYQLRMSPTRLHQIQNIEICLKEQVDPLEPKRYVSKLWMYKWRSFEDPGPINNSELLCPHRNIQPELKDTFHERIEILPDSVYRRLYSTHGGSALNHSTDTPPSLCAICLDQATLRLRRKKEKRKILQLERKKKDNVWFIISTKWLQEWRDFISENAPPPREINNSVLLDENGNPIPDLKQKIHYRGISKCVWYYFYSVYKGGPPIARADIDIYHPAILVPPDSSSTSSSDSDDVLHKKAKKETENVAQKQTGRDNYENKPPQEEEQHPAQNGK